MYELDKVVRCTSGGIWPAASWLGRLRGRSHVHDQEEIQEIILRVKPSVALIAIRVQGQATVRCEGDAARPVAIPPLLASGQEVADHLEEAGLVTLDARSPDRFGADHIPGAVNLPVASQPHQMVFAPAR